MPPYASPSASAYEVLRRAARRVPLRLLHIGRLHQEVRAPLHPRSSRRW
ncbi:hypothetical protein SBD_0756 [Streptomyces bottropensis ATCC 25435]|uniref:Uncharacterized protein n=1 Tax=Streptomyces bottropensis ATCC 25435 TaxID=1054862 RepID=M3G0K2_9ACTN|nr:hypothetical protein SBD_0756 [Streptomyces bottropensis ATCC 25435]